MNRKHSLPIISAEERPDQEPRSWWRSLEELAQAPEFEEYLHREFPDNADQPLTGSRRDFLRVIGASLLLAGAAGCNIKPPQEEIVPAAQSAGRAEPGLPLYFTTTFDFAGSALGLTVQSRDGRPIKVEGNSNHPASLGTTSIFAQAATLGLYDPDRLRMASRENRAVPRDEMLREIAALRGRLDETRGEGFRLLTETSTSPTLERLVSIVAERWPKSRWAVYDPIGDDHVRAGMTTAFGDEAAGRTPIYDFSEADVVLSIDYDFLAARDLPPRYIHDFTQRRRIAGLPSGDKPPRPMTRLYHLGSTPTLTSAKADRPLHVAPEPLWHIVQSIADGVGVDKQVVGSVDSLDDSELIAQWLVDVIADLRSAGERALVVAGRGQPPAIHALASAINDALGSIGRTVRFTHSPQVRPLGEPSDIDSLTRLTQEMLVGDVESLLMLGGNPVLTAPGDVAFGRALSQVNFSLALSLGPNATTNLCRWKVPQSHFLESWGDARAYDGTASLVQPLISPLYQSFSEIELLAALTGTASTGYEAVRQTWAAELGEGTSSRWEQALTAGVITEPDEGQHTTKKDAAPALVLQTKQPIAPPSDLSARQDGQDSHQTERFDVLLNPDPTVWDGRFVNNGWLQELPKPLTSIVWDNVAWIAPSDAERLKIQHGELLSIGEVDAAIEIPAWIVPGHAQGCLTLFVGYGDDATGRVGKGTGFNVYPLSTNDAPRRRLALPVRPTGRPYPIVTTQHHQVMEGRDLARAGTLDEYLAHPEHPKFAHVPAIAPEATFYEPWEYNGQKWGMTIDLTACVGCSACVIACQAENNIPVVGKRQAGANRHMHWIRVDTYYEGSPDHPERVLNQPVTCMQCERAPCEYVCPVAATNHSSEGLNQMVYNRCVGTRYCSNNCPYKVRRFNFHDFSEKFIDDESLTLLSNPEVTIRGRGVMEKCTYCIQHIQHARIAADLEDRPIRDGEIKTACQTVCPAGAIVFGDLNDKNSLVRQTHDHSLNYSLLEELNTEPRTTYLAAVTNPGWKTPEHKAEPGGIA